MNLPACFRGNFIPSSHCSACRNLQFYPLLFASSITAPPKQSNFQRNKVFPRVVFGRRELICRVAETDTEPDSNSNKDGKVHEDGEIPTSGSNDSIMGNNSELDSQPIVVDQDNKEPVELQVLDSSKLINNNGAEIKTQDNTKVSKGVTSMGITAQDADTVKVTSGSPLPGVKPPKIDEFIRIPKETIDMLKDQIFGFDTFFVTSQEPYEGGVLFKGNMRGQAARSYEKITKRMQDRFGDQYKLFFLINPEDDKPIAVVVPRRTLQPETTGSYPITVPEWFAAVAFGLVTIFTLLLRNVPALQSNLLSTFDNIELLKDGLPGALVTLLVLGVHEISHILVANSLGIKLGLPYFVPSWQIGSFGAITRIRNIVPKREDLLKVAVAGPLAGFSLGLVLLLSGFILPPGDGIGLIVDASVFHESLLVGGIAKLLLGDVLKEGNQISLNPLVVWAWAGLLINAINSIPAGELDGGRIALSIWGRKVSTRFTGASIVLLGLSSLFNDVAFYWVVLIFFLQRGPIAPIAEEITDPDTNYVALGVGVLLLGLLVCLPYPLPFTSETITSF
ncbi:hypothetical protein LguiA_023771 [Lonicera macranthoides]